MSEITHKNPRCPECGSTFIEWTPEKGRWHCLIKSCLWEQEKESKPEDQTHYYKYITGCWYKKEEE